MFSLVVQVTVFIFTPVIFKIIRVSHVLFEATPVLVVILGFNPVIFKDIIVIIFLLELLPLFCATNYWFGVTIVRTVG